MWNRSKEVKVDRKHIDTFHQPLYYWHMWRKRAIENYLPPNAYEKVGMSAVAYSMFPLPDRNYVKVDGKVVSGCDKKDLPKVIQSMGRKDYEAICDKLMVDGREISEIRLFLLKMAKVV